MPSEANLDDRWTMGHDIVMVYLGLASLGDNKTMRSELDAITQKFFETFPGCSDEDYGTILGEVDSRLKAAGDSAQQMVTYLNSVDRVAASLPDYDDSVGMARTLVTDLLEIGMADGELPASEIAMIKATANRLGLDLELSVAEDGKIAYSLPELNG